MLKDAILNLRRWNRRRLADRRSARVGRLDHPHRLGVLAIMKNEEMVVEEWIAHYLWQGAGRIYLIDNGSTDGTVARLRPWIDSGQVRLIILGQRHRQREHYWTAIEHFAIRDECQWLLIADLDEYWFCPSGQTLSDALATYPEGIDVVYCNCYFFGSSGHVRQPASIRQSFTARTPHVGPHNARKYLCRTSVLTGPHCIEIHGLVGACSSRTVSDNQLFQINHYILFSWEYFERVKMTRGDVINSIHDRVRDRAYFDRIDSWCTEADRRLADLSVGQMPSRALD